MANRTIVKGNIGNALHSVAPDHISTTADEIFDENLQQYQSEINRGSLIFTEGVYDVSEKNPTGGPNNDGKFTLEYILSNADTLIPSTVRKGGMSIKFVHTSDNKYVQYRLMADGWSVDTADWTIAEEGVYVENPEFIEVKTDSEGKILWAIKADGSIYWGAGVPQQVIDYVEGKISELSLDEYEDIVSFLDGFLGTDTTLQAILESLNITIASKVSKEEGKGLSTNDYTNEDKELVAVHEIVDNPEYIKAEVDSECKLLAGRTPDGAAFENVGFSTPKISIDGTTLSNIEDPEGRIEIKTDPEEKIISYRDEDGVLHENGGVITKDITSEKFNGLSISEIQSLDVRLPIVNVISPYNLIVDGNNIIGLSPSKNEVECTIEFISNEKRFTEDNCAIAYQGNSTLGDEKKGFSIVFPIKHRFKDWIEMDEYRLKGYGQDWTSGKDVIGNRLYGQILATRNYKTNKPWKKYNDFSNSSIRKLMDADKKCHMDGFPVELYINGSYWGVYVFEIRKERDNYNLDKKNNNHIQIEGENMYADSRFTWNTVEIRNPKGYDEYVEPADGPVKTFITNWFNGISTITSATTQEELEEYLDCQNFIDWYLHNAMICNHDVINKNTEFTTWDNKHITLIPQDLNGGWTLWAYDYDELSQKAYAYCSWLQTALTILDTPIKERYAELRKKGIFTIENITKLWEDWGREIGTDAYDADQKRWNRQRDSFDTILQWAENRITYLDTRFDYSQN